MFQRYKVIKSIQNFSSISLKLCLLDLTNIETWSMTLTLASGALPQVSDLLWDLVTNFSYLPVSEPGAESKEALPGPTICHRALQPEESMMLHGTLPQVLAGFLMS